MTPELTTFFATISIVVSFGVALGFSLVLLVLPHSPALRAWVASVWLLALSVLFQQVTPAPVGWVMMGLVTASALCGAALLIKGVALHVGRRLPPWKPMLVMAPLLLAMLVDARLLHVAGMQRNLSNLSGVVMYGWITWMLLRHAPVELRLSYRLAAGVFALHVLFGLYGLGFSGEVSADSAQELSFAVLYRICGGIVLLMAQCFALMLLLVEQLFQELRDRAMRDGLTGLLNRAALVAAGQQKLDEATARDECFAAMIIDLDNFKQVNDTWGHLSGDDVLIHFSRLAQDCVSGRNGLLGRYGGEEFILLLPGATERSAMELAQRMLAMVRGAAVETAVGALGYTISIGVQVSAAGATLEHLLTRADMALYRAKAGGRDQACLAGSEECWTGLPGLRAPRQVALH